MFLASELSPARQTVLSDTGATCSPVIITLILTVSCKSYPRAQRESMEHHKDTVTEKRCLMLKQRHLLISLSLLLAAKPRRSEARTERGPHRRQFPTVGNDAFPSVCASKGQFKSIMVSLATCHHSKLRLVRRRLTQAYREGGPLDQLHPI